jgi:hypothetical protein
MFESSQRRIENLIAEAFTPPVSRASGTGG